MVWDLGEISPNYESTSVTVMDFDYDVIVVGSGFGGSVAALRLTEKIIKFWSLKRDENLRTKITLLRHGKFETSCLRQQLAALVFSEFTCCRMF